MARFPTEPEQLTAKWLSEALDTEIEDIHVEQIGVGVGLLGRLYRVTVDAPDAPHRSLVAKIATLDEGARRNVAEPLRFYEKEVRFYQWAERADTMPTPTTLFADIDPDTGDFLLLLEDLCDRRTVDQLGRCSPEDARATVDAIAAHHAAWWQHDQLEKLDWLPSYADEPFPAVLTGMLTQSWPRFEEGFSDHVPDAIRRFGEKLPSLTRWFMESFSQPPVTFGHGDLRLDNLFFAAHEDHPAVTAIDWQIAGKARGAYDLGYFLSQSLAVEDRREHETELVESYRSTLAEAGIDYPEAELWTDYRRTIAWCLVYPINVAGQIELANDRARALVTDMLDRAVAAIEDHDALEVVPA